jgi:pyruvate dehydrogenase E1 component beta subunit
VVEEGYRSLGVGAEIGATLFERALPWLDRPFRRMAIPDVPLAASRQLVDRVLPSADAIAAEIRDILK